MLESLLDPFQPLSSIAKTSCLTFCLYKFQPTSPLSVLCYANGGPIIKANDVGNDKPTGRRGPRGVKSPQGSALIWMPAAVMAKHRRDGRSSVMRECGKWKWADAFQECHISTGHTEASVAFGATEPAVEGNGKCTLSIARLLYDGYYSTKMRLKRAGWHLLLQYVLKILR